MANRREEPAPETGEGRAQPGDVIGFDTDGERTHLGETREDEDERRQDAEKTVRDRDDAPKRD